MKIRVMALLCAALFVAVSASQASAIINCTQTGCRATGAVAHALKQPRRHSARSFDGERTLGVSVQASVDARPDPRPSAWCAWWLRRHLGIPRSAFPPYQYNLARAFVHIGSPAPRGCTGCIAVFSRGRGGHVGVVEDWDAHGNPVVLSGNFNGHVDTAPHPRNRLIALRWPN